MKALTIVGARPQFVKAAVLNRIFNSFEDVTEILVHTGQHFDTNMSDIFFEELRISKPKYNLNINGGLHGYQVGKMMMEIELILLDESPNVVILYGDTNSTLAGALAASKLYIPIVHIEAGLRSFNNQMPEEINRILVDRVSDLLITPSKTATNNLLAEGMPREKIFEFGDIMYDAVLSVPYIAVRDDFDVLCTLHRPVNTDNPSTLLQIVRFLIRVAREKRILLLLHPRTRKCLLENGLLENLSQSVSISPPVGYIETINYLRNSSLLITDSGGMQKEAFYAGKNSLVLRDETEWVELVDGGYSRLVSIEDLQEISIDNIAFSQDFDKPIFGKGNTGILIFDQLRKWAE